VKGIRGKEKLVAKRGNKEQSATSEDTDPMSRAMANGGGNVSNGAAGRTAGFLSWNGGKAQAESDLVGIV